jgi:predicted GNAT superfamily acetyltransferase
MTEQMTARACQPAAAEVATEAASAAHQAAARSGVIIRDLSTLADVARVCELFGQIWRAEPGSEPVTPELLRVFAHTGNHVSGAFAGDDLVGACVGFLAAPAGEALHSHVTGVSARMAGRHVGFALKLHQRAWALARGLSVITWTFDPLVRRNAYFNIVKLGAVPVEYLPDFYGRINDGINTGDETDRLLARWSLDAETVARACAGAPVAGDAARLRAAGAVTALDTDAAGLPVRLADGDRADIGSADTVLVRVPADIEAMRRDGAAGAAAAGRWRRAVREVLGELLAGGGTVTGFDRAGWYVVRRGPAG